MNDIELGSLFSFNLIEGDVFRGYNHVHDTVKMFRSTYTKYHGNDGIEVIQRHISVKLQF